jgi:hypothetical protein
MGTAMNIRLDDGSVFILQEFHSARPIVRLGLLFDEDAETRGLAELYQRLRGWGELRPEVTFEDFCGSRMWRMSWDEKQNQL